MLNWIKKLLNKDRNNKISSLRLRLAANEDLINVLQKQVAEHNKTLKYLKKAFLNGMNENNKKIYFLESEVYLSDKITNPEKLKFKLKRERGISCYFQTQWQIKKLTIEMFESGKLPMKKTEYQNIVYQKVRKASVNREQVRIIIRSLIYNGWLVEDKGNKSNTKWISVRG